MPVQRKDIFAYLFTPTREAMATNPTPEEQETTGRHFQYLKRLSEEGALIMAARELEAPYLGLAILDTSDREAAQRIMEDDPAVARGVFSARLSGFRIVMTREGGI